ncbi:AMP-binding protein [Pseudomonas sp. NPDC089918]|uniref:AMP-binding protein n=1 Tax=Pseudomonas sp. NPDC089918 TaxID=3390654 RepID=UPI003D05AE55
MIGVRDPLPGVVYPPLDRLRTYVESGELSETSLIEALMASFADNAGAPALCTADGIISYAEFDERTDRFAAALLEMGLVPLDRVLFQAGNSPELIIALISCLKAGLIPTCTLAPHREREISYLGRHVDAKAFIVQGDDAKFDLEAFALKMQPEIPTVRHVISFRGRPRDGVVRMEDLIAATDAAKAYATVRAVPRDAYQVAVFQLSGGTTGVPKVIPRMQNDYLLNATLTIEAIGYRHDDVMFMPMPMMHNACMICFIMPVLLVGAAFVIPEDLTPEAWAAAFKRTPPTYIGVIRPLLPRLEAAFDLEPAALGHVRAFWSADSARTLREKYDRPTYALFGMSEGMNMYCRPDDSEEARDWTVGRPLSSFDEVRLVVPGTMDEVADGEIGEMICRGPYTVSGYFNAPERNRDAFTPDGFYKPGDLLVRRVIDGKRYYAFAGRLKDVVDRGSEKINCEEVELAVSTHVAVAGCAVVGMPDPILGERVCVYVVLRGGHQAPSVRDFQVHMEGLGLAKFKWPERVVTIDALPLTKVGKIDKAALRTDIAKRLEQRDVVTN